MMTLVRALGEEAWRATREKLGWPLEEWFRVPEEATAHARERADLGRALHQSWNTALQRYRDAYPEAAAELERVMRGELPDGWADALPSFTPDDGPVATRNAGGDVLNALAGRLPELLGGSADLAPSTKTLIEDGGDFAAADRTGRNLRFGVREHAMMAAVNGMALHGGVIPYGSTFLIFSDYARPAIRLGALMGVKALYVFTHDSIGLGEDGPTHQPVSQLLALRGIPGLVTVRPADANETVAAWRFALGHDGPVAMALSRQKLPVLDADPRAVAEGVARGAYVLVEAEGGEPALVLAATGSEVALVREAAARLAERGVPACVVSMPSWELFDAQDAAYRERVLPRAVPALAVEAGSPRGWRDYVGDRGAVLGLTRFGASAPGEEVMARLGFTVDNVVEHALALLERE